MSEQNTSKSVDKAIDLLELFFAHDELTLSELSELSGIQRSIVSRLVATLANRGYLYQREKGASTPWAPRISITADW